MKIFAIAILTLGASLLCAAAIIAIWGDDGSDLDKVASSLMVLGLFCSLGGAITLGVLK